MKNKILKKIFSIFGIACILISVFSVPCLALCNDYDQWGTTYIGSGTPFNAIVTEYDDDGSSYLLSSINTYSGPPSGMLELQMIPFDRSGNSIIPYYVYLQNNLFDYGYTYHSENRIVNFFEYDSFIDANIVTPTSQINGVFEYYLSGTDIIDVYDLYNMGDAYISFYTVLPNEDYVSGFPYDFYDPINFEISYDKLVTDYSDYSYSWEFFTDSISITSDYCSIIDRAPLIDNAFQMFYYANNDIKSNFRFAEIRFYYNRYFLDQYDSFETPIENVYHIGTIYKNANFGVSYDNSSIPDTYWYALEDSYYFNTNTDVYNSWLALQYSCFFNGKVPIVGFTVDNENSYTTYEGYVDLNDSLVYSIFNGQEVVIEQVTLSDFNVFRWLGDTLGGILDVNIVGNDTFGISLGGVLGVGMFIAVFMWFLRTFAGG